jgi:hypothetical protein
MPCSHVFEFGNLSLVVFTCLRQRLGLSSERLYTSTKTLSTQRLPRAWCPPPFLWNFLKNPDNLVETDRTSERFFDGNSISWKEKTTAYVGWGVAVCSKLLVLTPPRLRHEDLRLRLRVLRFSSDLFSKSILVTAWTPVQKTISHVKPRQVTSRTFRVLGGCEQVVALSGLRRPRFPTPTPPWLQSKAQSPWFSKINYSLLQSSSGARKRSGCNAIQIKYLATRLVAFRLVRVITWNKLWYNYLEGL